MFDLELLYPDFEFAIAALSRFPASSAENTSNVSHNDTLGSENAVLDAVCAAHTRVKVDGKMAEVTELEFEQVGTMIEKEMHAVAGSTLMSNLSAWCARFALRLAVKFSLSCCGGCWLSLGLWVC